MDIYKNLFRPYFFLQDPEAIHNRIVRLLVIFQKLKIPLPIIRAVLKFEDPRLEIKAFGLTFKNPVGLAAGFDKEGKVSQALSCLSFGHLELGTVTLLPQEGNPRPRIFRLIKDEALINRMGFPSGGVEVFIKNLQNRPTNCVIGVNIGKGKNTPLEKADQDYRLLLQNVYPASDYIVINVSSPNTVGLRQLQAKNYLKDLLRGVKKTRASLDKSEKPKPLLLKIAPDLSWDELDDVLEVVIDEKIDGLVATNTTIDRGVLKSKSKAETGGLSGKPLKVKSTEIIWHIYKNTKGKIPIIGVGGIFNAEDAWEKICAGASLVQVYTGLIYEGPSLVKKINQGLVKKMKEVGVSSITEIIGSATN